MRRTTAASCLSALLVAVAAPPAVAAEARPAGGDAVSNVTLLTATVADQTATVLDVALRASNLDGRAASITVAPLTSTGTGSVAPVTVTPADSPVTLGAAGPISLAGGLVTLSSPALNASAADTADALTAEVAARGLGTLTLLGAPVTAGDVTLRGLSSVTGAESRSTKSFVVRDLALPSLADLLAGLGLDLGKLPAGTLNDLIRQLNLGDVTTGALGTANAAIDTAQQAVTDAQAALAPLQQALTTAKADQTAKAAAAATAAQALTSATTALDTAIAAVPDATLIALGLPADITVATMTAAQKTLLASIPTLTSLVTAYDSALAADAAAKTALAAANAAVATAQAALDAAQAAIAGLVNTLTAAVATLAGLVNGILDGAPLVSLGSIDVNSIASAAKTGTADINGTVTGLEVAGTDVLQTVTGAPSVDVTQLLGAVGGQVQGAIDALTTTLSDVLDGAVPGLVFPSPEIAVLEKVTDTGTSAEFATARAALTALRVSMPAVSVPAIAALPASLPANATAVATPAFSLELLNVGDTARFRPAVLASAPGTGTPTGGGVTTPTGGGGTLPNTGVSAVAALAATLLVTGGLLLARRRETLE